MIDFATGGSATLIILMSSDLLIKNGRVIDPANGIDRQCDVLVVDGRIAEVGGKIGGRRQETEERRQNTEEHLTVFAAVGKLVVSGSMFVPVCFREPGDEEEETIAS